MAQQTYNNGDSGLAVRTVIDANFTELYGLASIPQYFITESGVTQTRFGTRGDQGVIDITDTPLGFAGVEGVDWHNVFKQS